MKKKVILFLLLIYQISFGQIKDTVYIYFDNNQVGMKKGIFKDIKSKKYPNENIPNSYVYKIAEKKTKNSELFDTGYTFTHYVKSKFKLERGEINPFTITKDIYFLKTKKLLENDFFQKTNYTKVCKTFEKENSREQDVVILLVDKAEIRNGKLILREVNFQRPDKE